MNCREVVEFLMDYLSGDLSSGTRRHFEQHLSDCPPCEVYLDSYARTIRLARDAFCVAADAPHVEPPPPELVDAIAASLRAADRRPEVEDDDPDRR